MLIAMIKTKVLKMIRIFIEVTVMIATVVCVLLILLLVVLLLLRRIIITSIMEIIEIKQIAVIQ